MSFDENYMKNIIDGLYLENIVNSKKYNVCQSLLYNSVVANSGIKRHFFINYQSNNEILRIVKNNSLVQLR
jgi:hypothetical protein